MSKQQQTAKARRTAFIQALDVTMNPEVIRFVCAAIDDVARHFVTAGECGELEAMEAATEIVAALVWKAPKQILQIEPAKIAAYA